MYSKPHKTYTYNTALEALRKYCAYQERSHSEVTQKAKQLQLTKPEIDQAICQLIEENFLNEARFAEMYVKGKFNLKHWGPQKIKQHLKQKGISDPLIESTLSQLSMVEIDQIIQQLIAQKSALLDHEKNPFVKKQKLIRYLVGKGFDIEKVLYFLDQKTL